MLESTSKQIGLSNADREQLLSSAVRQGEFSPLDFRNSSEDDLRWFARMCAELDYQALSSQVTAEIIRRASRIVDPFKAWRKSRRPGEVGALTSKAVAGVLSGDIN